MWFVYLVECNDNTLYCGMTNNIEKRIETHNLGNGAKYTKSRLPVKLVKSWEFETKSLACKEEYRIKKLKRSEKLEFI